jgi:cell surface protein SprA
MPGTKILGQKKLGDEWAPGWPFIIGLQDDNFLYRVADKGWLTKDTLINNPFVMVHNENFNFRTTFEPFKGIRVDIIANRRFSSNSNEYFKYDDPNGRYNYNNQMITGNFSMTYITMKSMFEKIRDDNSYQSRYFDLFRDYTRIISERLARKRQEIDPTYDPDIDPETGLPIQTGYKNGYSMTSQEVMLPAFLAAYAGKDPEKVSLQSIPKITQVLPNWRVVIDIFNNIQAVKSVFRSVNILHAYRSTYNIASYQSNLNYLEDDDGLSWIRDLEYNFIPPYQINTVSITEQFAPLAGLDLTWKNGITSKVEYKKSRNLALSLGNNQLTEVYNEELVVGTGYRFNSVKLTFRSAGGQSRELKSDLNLRADVSIRDNKTIMRKLLEDTNIPTAGQKIITLKFTADYMLSDKFNVRIFFDRIVNSPFVALTFPTANTNFGISLRFTLMQ